MRKEAVTNNVPYIVGCNSTEGRGNAIKYHKSSINRETYENDFKGFVKRTFCVSIF